MAAAFNEAEAETAKRRLIAAGEDPLTDAAVDHLLYEVGWFHGIPWVPTRRLAVYIEDLREKLKAATR